VPGNSWRDLRERRPVDLAGSPGRVAGLPASLGDAANGSPRLAELLEQRERLERRMQRLTGDAATPGGGDGRRYRVPSFAERRREQEAFEARRDRGGRRSAERAAPEEPPLRGAPGRGPADPGGDARQWLRERDAWRQSLRESARDRLSPVYRARQALRGARRLLGGAAGGPRRAPAPGTNDPLSGRTPGTGRDPAAADAARDATRAATHAIDDDWDARRERISGPLDRIGSYADRAERLLSTETGGSGDVFERLRRNRERALERRREERRQEARDQARRDRALRLRREREGEA
jgi:hypothetical protein